MTNKKKIVLAYSGGLDTSIIIPWLKEHHDCEVYAYCGDVGQGSSELQGLEQKAHASGASGCRVDDLRREFLTGYVWPCLRAMTVYEGRYLLGTSMARPILAKGQVDYAHEIGATAARAGYVLLTGGLSGVMQRAARGAAEAGGETMGILPGTVKAEANPYVRVVVPSGIGIARNYLMALTADVMVAVNGGRGTLEEICYALDFERRVLTWDSWPMDGAEKITSLEQCEAALVEHLEAALLAQLGDSNNA